MSNQDEQQLITVREVITDFFFARSQARDSCAIAQSVSRVKTNAYPWDSLFSADVATDTSLSAAGCCNWLPVGYFGSSYQLRGGLG